MANVIHTKLGEGRRVAIPAELCQRYGIEPGDPVVLEPTDSGIVYLYALASQVGLSAAAPRFRYLIESYDLFGLSPDDLPPELGQFNAYDSALVGQGQFATLEPNAATRLALGVQRREWTRTPAKGLMVVLAENPAGPAQAELYPFEQPH